MARGSKRFLELQKRCNELQGNLLSFVPAAASLSKTSYTAKELDMTRSYIVLIHAEFESFCEDIASQKATRAEAKFHAGKLTPVMKKLLSYFVGKKGRSWSDVLLPSPTVIRSAMTSYMDGIRINHGVKRENLERLFYPLGITDADLNVTWLAQMDSFGTNRGTWAHNTIKTFTPPDPVTELSTVTHLLTGLYDLDRAVAKIR